MAEIAEPIRVTRGIENRNLSDPAPHACDLKHGHGKYGSECPNGRSGPNTPFGSQR